MWDTASGADLSDHDCEGDVPIDDNAYDHLFDNHYLVIGQLDGDYYVAEFDDDRPYLNDRYNDVKHAIDNDRANPQ